MAVRGERELVWWPSSGASLEESESFAFEAAICSVMDHKKFDEVAVSLRDGRVLLFSLASKKVVSRIGEEKAKLVTVWSGLYSLSKIAHVLLVVFDASKNAHHLRVIRLTSKRVDDKESCVLEHVCAHLLVPPVEEQPESGRKSLKGSKKKKIPKKQSEISGSNVIKNATFDAAGLVLSCSWSSGVFASYAFGRSKQLASLDVNVSPREATTLLSVSKEVVATMRFVAFREHHVCFVVGDYVVLYNTVFGTVVSQPLALSLEENDPVVSFIASSNDSFFLLATRSKLLRINVVEPESSSLVHSLGSAARTERIFGPQPSSSSVALATDYSFSIVYGAGVVSAEPSIAVPSSGEKLGELMSSRCVLGTGYSLRGPRRFKDAPKEAIDTYSLSPDFGAAAALEFAKRKDWHSVQKIVEAQLFAFPPRGLVEMAVAFRQTSVLMALVEYCSALSKEDLSSVLAYSLSESYEQPKSRDQGFSNALLLAIVAHQKSTFHLELDPAQLQSLFSQLVAMYQACSVLSAPLLGIELSPLVDWLCCVIDSKPLSFSLDPKMAEAVVQLSQRVKREVALVKTLSDVEVALDVVKDRQIPAASQQSSLYSIEYLSFAD